MICGGTCLILVEALGDREPYRVAFDRLRQGERTLLAKAISRAPGGTRREVTTAVLGENGQLLCGSLPPSIGKKAERALQGGTPAYLEEEGIFLDPVFPEEKLLILGGGYVGRAVAFQASGLDFKVTVADDRAGVLRGRAVSSRGWRLSAETTRRSCGASLSTRPPTWSWSRAAT